ncbi:hypothetical protein HK104_001600 [Borealophlyctis nickersoniae]|nr:hypothetical protein HK104_001600 [Borealophlyctis nickersoniae]
MDEARIYLSYLKAARTDEARMWSPDTLRAATQAALKIEHLAPTITPATISSTAYDLHLPSPPIPESLRTAQRLLYKTLLVNPYLPMDTYREVIWKYTEVCGGEGVGDEVLLKDISEMAHPFAALDVLSESQSNLLGALHNMADAPYSGTKDGGVDAVSEDRWQATAVEYAYRLHPDTIAKRVSARFLMPELARCLDGGKDIGDDSDALRERLDSFLRKLSASGMELGDVMEILAIMLTLPASSLAAPSDTPLPTSIPSNSDSFIALATSDVQENSNCNRHILSWLLSHAADNSPTSPLLWSMHPWLLAELSGLYFTFFTAYLKHLVESVRHVQNALLGIGVHNFSLAPSDDTAASDDGEDDGRDEMAHDHLMGLKRHWAVLLGMAVEHVRHGAGRAVGMLKREVEERGGKLDPDSEVGAMWRRVWKSFFELGRADGDVNEIK